MLPRTPLAQIKLLRGTVIYPRPRFESECVRWHGQPEQPDECDGRERWPCAESCHPVLACAGAHLFDVALVRRWYCYHVQAGSDTVQGGNVTTLHGKSFAEESARGASELSS